MNGLRRLRDGPLTVVWANLDTNRGDATRALAETLSADEHDRSGRFRHTVDRDRFIACRGILRLLLGQRLGVDPQSLRLATSGYGKPRLLGAETLDFNVSHSKGEALIAISDRGEVGVDIEHLRPLDPLQLSRTVFSMQEQDELRATDPSLRQSAFFNGWVRKEAVLKADGRGLSMGLGSFSVSLLGAARMVAAPVGSAGYRWQLHSIELGPHVRAAIAVHR